MRNPNAFLSITIIFLFLHLTLLRNGELLPAGVAAAGKRKVEITDDLNDVIDDEEDDDWKEWGKKKEPEFDPPPTDFDNMDFAEIQAQMMKRSMGPVFGFVKLVFNVPRTPEMVSEIAMKWSKVLRTAAMEVKFWGVDRGTIMFNMQAGSRDIIQLKEFILDQPEAYEVKIGDQAFRRPGDPPVETVLQKLHNEKNEASDSNPTEDSNDHKEEL